jgi:hypothetical protein
MRWISCLLLFSAVPSAAQVIPVLPAPQPAVWNPAAPYITVGQDEVGYRGWYSASMRHAAGVKGFNDYLAQYGVSGVVPTWQLLRTATSWQRCGGAPFEVPPLAEWPNIVQTLRYIHDYVIPTVGPVEPVSAYRNPHLNSCAGGAPESAHKHYSAVDMVPLQQITREELMRKLCAVHARRGTDYSVGLGFYAFIRFHVDTTKFRRWGADPNVAGCPSIIRPKDVASVAMPQATATGAAVMPQAATMPPIIVAPTTAQGADPLAPTTTPPIVYGPILTSPTASDLQPQQP